MECLDNALDVFEPLESFPWFALYVSALSLSVLFPLFDFSLDCAVICSLPKLLRFKAKPKTCNELKLIS